MKKYLAEGLGTFFLTLTVILVSNNDTEGFAPLAVGVLYTAMIYAGARVSGAHYNPAISVAMLLRGSLDRRDLPYYILAQTLGAVLSALIGGFLLACGDNADVQAHQNEGLCAVVAEFLGAFMLMYVFLQVITTRENKDQSFYGIAIGCSMTAGMYVLGNISGGLFNPAVALGASIVDLYFWADFWIYLVGPLLGAAAATTVYQLMFGKEEQAER